MSDDQLGWRAVCWAPAGSATRDLVLKALGDAAQEPGPGARDLHRCDLAVLVGLDRLGVVVRRLPAKLPLAVVLQEPDLRGRRLPASTVGLIRHGPRVNLVLVAGDAQCRRLAAVRVRIPVARHDGDAATLAGWLRRAHAYGYLCGRRALSG